MPDRPARLRGIAVVKRADLVAWIAKVGDDEALARDGRIRQLALRRVARPDAEQKRILTALQLEIPERLSADRLL